MIEPEMAYLEHEGNMALQKEFLSYLVGRVLERRGFELEVLGRDLKTLEPSAEGDYPRLSYDEALEVLREAGQPLEWGKDFGAPHEMILGECFDRPVMIHAWPAEAIPFPRMLTRMRP
jgi:asparaginyl-tRNA synthetase